MIFAIKYFCQKGSAVRLHHEAEHENGSSEQSLIRYNSEITELSKSPSETMKNGTLVEVAATFYRHLQKMPANFFYKTWKIQGPCMETFCKITMQLSLFELKLKTFPLLHHRDHFVFTCKFLK